MKFSTRPVFVGWIILLIQLPLQIFFTVWAGMFFGGLLSTTGVFSDSWVPTYIFGGLAFFGIPLAAYIGRKFNYKRSEYRFYDDRVEFEEGFLTIHKKTIRYKDVKEVTLKRGILQRMCGLGTIYVGTQATGLMSYASPFSALGFGSTSTSGLNVRDVAGPEETYQRIKVLTDATS